MLLSKKRRGVNECLLHLSFAFQRLDPWGTQGEWYRFDISPQGREVV